MTVSPEFAASEENQRRIRNVEDCFGSMGQPLQKTGRVLVGEGVLTKLCRKKPKPRQFFLFNDLLVYGNILINKKKYNKQHVLPLEEVRIIALNDEGYFTNGWQIISPTKSFAVYAATPLEKDEWMAHINKSIKDLLKNTGKTPSGREAAVWVPDTSTDYCMKCRKTKFTTLIRRHHCRQCGSVVCGSCSSKKKLIPHISGKPVRVCDGCFMDISEPNITNVERATDGVTDGGAGLKSVGVGCTDSLSRREAEKFTESGSSADESDGENDNDELAPNFFGKGEENGEGAGAGAEVPTRPNGPPST